MLEIRIQGLRVESYPAENPRYRSRLLLVHGLWSGAWSWRAFGSFLAHRGWEVLAVDLRGRPGSLETPLSEVRLADYRCDLDAVLASEALAPSSDADLDPPVVIGHDVGALLALTAAAEGRCRAAIALAPPVPPAMTAGYRRMLRGRWLRGTIDPPPATGNDSAPATGVLQEDSRQVGRDLVAGELVPATPRVPAAIVAGNRDPWIDSERLERMAGDLGCDFLIRPAGHWGLDGPGFERQVDQLHRWIVRTIGPDLLRLTGHEDLDDDEDSNRG